MAGIPHVLISRWRSTQLARTIDDESVVDEECGRPGLVVVVNICKTDIDV